MDDDGDLWTLDQLAEQVSAALAVDYAGPENGRVRAVPDRRTIRWYTTIGLVDRPAAMRGRTALYHRRHLAQLVAIKRLQAQGRPLASIQQDLTGASQETLERIAALPAGAPAPVAPPQVAASARPRFWAATPPRFAAARVAAAATAGPVPAGPVPADAIPVGPAADAAGGDSEQPALAPASSTNQPSPPPPRSLLPAVQLGPGAALLLLGSDRQPTPGELAVIQAAAAPMLDVLHRLGLDGPPHREEPR